MALDFREEMVNYILSRMEGSNDIDSIMNPKPSKMFVLGSLAPMYLNNNLDNNDDILQSDKVASIKATRFRVSILIKKDDIKSEKPITVEVTGNVFYKIKSDKKNTEDNTDYIDDNKSNYDEKYQWKRKPFNFPINLNLNQNKLNYEFNLPFPDIINECNQDPSIFKELSPENWNGNLVIKLEKYGSINYIVHFFVDNTSSYDPKKDNNYEKAFFDCKLSVDLGDLKTVEFNEEYKYNNFKQKYFYDFRTINCQARFENKEKTKFKTSHYYLFKQEKIEPLSSNNQYDLSFNFLSSNNWKDSLKNLENRMEDLLTKYKQNYNDIKNDNNSEFLKRIGNRQIEIDELKSSIEDFEKILHTYSNSIDLLSNNKTAEEAFIGMNKVFDNHYKNKLGDKKYKNSSPGWRVFQIVFIVSIIRSIVSKEDLDTVDVLHVTTGGGKSEAYFGIIVFSMLYERLTGKTDGVTAIVKFPLRMLSIQQMERLASIIIYAEEYRKNNLSKFNGKEFSLGYYVGDSDDFPDLYSKIQKELYKDSKKTIFKNNVPSRILTFCPVCDNLNRGNIFLRDDVDGKRVIHQCSNFQQHKFYIYYSDREIYRYRPTVIVSTVDKWASLSQQRKARALLGSNGSYCPNGHGFIPSGDQCEDKEEEGICKEIGEDKKGTSGPIISIQDEIHLLKESFGTISSHFESLIEEIIRSNSNGNKIKHIAMSATLNGIEHQINELYKKNSFIISGGNSITNNPSFELFFKKTENIQRLIYGMKPNIRDNHYSTLRTTLHAIEFLDKAQKEFLEDNAKFYNKYGLKNEEEAITLFKDYLSILTYHLKKQDAEDMDRFSDAVINDTLTNENISLSKGTVLTGDSGIDKLKETIDKIISNSKNYDIDKQTSETEGKYEPVFATSVVSHGIDLSELNFMIFQGIPYTTSEYIQALSRVGRAHEGIVIVWLYPNRVRDGSFYTNFKRYHESLDHEVLPAPIKRNSTLGILQTVNSMFCAGVIQYMSNKKGRPLIHKSDIEQLSQIDRADLIDFIQKVYGNLANLNLEKEVEERINQIKNSNSKPNEFFPNVLRESEEYYYRNQIGMRGIQGSLSLDPSGPTRQYLKEFDEGD